MATDANYSDPSTNVSKPGRRNELAASLGAYKGTLVLCVLVTLLTAPVHAGFMLIFVLPVFLFWVPYSFGVIARDPGRRQSQKRKLVIWAVLLASIACLQWYYAHAAERNANEIVFSIKQFMKEHGRCPSSLNEIGINRQQLTNRLGYSAYFCENDGKPKFFFAATFVVFSTYKYDFANNTWVYRAG